MSQGEAAGGLSPHGKRVGGVRKHSVVILLLDGRQGRVEELDKLGRVHKGRERIAAERAIFVPAALEESLARSAARKQIHLALKAKCAE